MSVPIGEALAGVEIAPLDDGHTALGIVAVIKALTDEGRVCWFVRGADMEDAEEIGALTMALDLRRKQSLECFEPDEDD